MSMPELHALVLAAGRSQRFGSPKQQAQIEGVALLERVVMVAVQAFPAAHVTVVLGHDSGTLRRLVEPHGALICRNDDYDEGIGASIRAGMQSVPATAGGVLILLGDQVAVTAADLATLAAAWRSQPERRVAAEYGGTAGVPAIFPASDFPTLASLAGDRGAQRLLHAGESNLVTVPMPSAAIDIDTTADLEAFRAGRLLKT
jgi:molybdenum cofactor cytidylyltransferase